MDIFFESMLNLLIKKHSTCSVERTKVGLFLKQSVLVPITVVCNFVSQDID